MLIALLLMLVALTANIWLWGHWSFERSSGLSLILVINSILLFYVFLAPTIRGMKKKSFDGVLKTWPIKICFYLILIFTIILCVASFYGLMQYLLPIKIFLLAIFAFLKFKKKKMRKVKS